MRFVKVLLVLAFAMSANMSYGIELTKLATFEGAGAPKSVEVSPDGRYAAVMNLEARNFWLIDTQTLKIAIVGQFPGTPAQGHDYNTHQPINSYAEKPVECAWTSDSRYVWMSFHNGSCVVVYDTQNARVTNHEPLQKVTIADKANGTNFVTYLSKIMVLSTPKVVAITPDGRLALVANWFGSAVSVIDIATMKLVKNVIVGGGNNIPRGLAVSSDSKMLYVANMRGGTISVIDLTTLTVVKNLAICPNPRHIVLSRDDRYLYITDNASGRLIKYDLVESKVANQITLGTQARTVALTPDEKYAFVAMHTSDQIVVVDTQTFTVVKKITFYRPMGLSVTPDGTQLWATSYQGGYVTCFKITY